MSRAARLGAFVIATLWQFLRSEFLSLATKNVSSTRTTHA